MENVRPSRSVEELSEKVDMLMLAMLGEGGTSGNAMPRTRKSPAGALQVHERVDASWVDEDACADTGHIHMRTHLSCTICLQERQAEAQPNKGTHTNGSDAAGLPADSKRSDAQGAALPVSPSGSLSEWRAKSGRALGEDPARNTTRSGARVGGSSRLSREGGSDDSDSEPQLDVEWSSRPSVPPKAEGADAPLEVSTCASLMADKEHLQIAGLIGCKLGIHIIKALSLPKMDITGEHLLLTDPPRMPTGLDFTL